MEKIIQLKLKFISWFHSLFPGKYCWADCVSWAYSNKWNPFNIESSKGCEVESIYHQNKSCYCGSWNNGMCFDKLSKTEQQKIRDEINCERERTKDEMPF